MSARQQLGEWLRQRGFRPKHLRWERFVSEGDARGRVIFATTKNNYFLVFKDTYLGLTASSRHTRPGENWTRGNDLPDGEFSEETLDRALNAILFYELREVSDVPGGGQWHLEDDSEGVPDTLGDMLGREGDSDECVESVVVEGGACYHGKDDTTCDDHCVCACHKAH